MGTWGATPGFPHPAPGACAPRPRRPRELLPILVIIRQDSRPGRTPSRPGYGRAGGATLAKVSVTSMAS